MKPVVGADGFVCPRPTGDGPHPSAKAASAQLRAEDPVFFDEMVKGFLPLVVPPARKSHQP